LGLSFIGIIGVIVLAKKEVKISKVTPLLNQLIKAGIRISPELVKMAKKLSGEK